MYNDTNKNTCKLKITEKSVAKFKVMSKINTFNVMLRLIKRIKVNNITR